MLPQEIRTGTGCRSSWIAPNAVQAPQKHPPSPPRFEDKATAETVFYVADALGVHFRVNQGRSDVVWACDLPIRYNSDRPTSQVVPDLFVTFGGPWPRRDVFSDWKAGQAPAFTLDIASASHSERRNWRAKPKAYAALGVLECWRFDPTGEYFKPQLQGYAWNGNSYAPLQSVTQNGCVTIRSKVLGLEFQAAADGLRIRDPQNGRTFPTVDEAMQEFLRAKQSLEEEIAARQAVERERDREAETRRKAEAHLESVRAQLRDAKQDHQAAEAHLEFVRAQLRDAKQDRLAAEAHLESVRAQARDAKQDRLAAEAHLESVRAQLRDAKQDRQAAQRQAEAAEAECRAAVEARNALLQRRNELEAEIQKRLQAKREPLASGQGPETEDCDDADAQLPAELSR